MLFDSKQWLIDTTAATITLFCKISIFYPNTKPPHHTRHQQRKTNPLTIKKHTIDEGNPTFHTKRKYR